MNKNDKNIPKSPASEGLARRRLSFEERRESIIKALIPLFESKNPQLVTTKDIADAAKISEALLYQHFKSKEELFSAVHDVLCQRIPALDQAIAAAIPSTKSLVLYFYLLAWISIKKPLEIKIDPLFPRLMMQSILGDRSFALLHEERRLGSLCELIASSLREAEKSGDLQSGIHFSPDLKEARLAFWFGVHLITMVYLNKVGDRPHSQYPENPEILLDKTMHFLLMGIGLRAEAISRYYDHRLLEETVKNLINTSKINEREG
jgi:AcrR family transcriptional regulator